MLPKLPVKLIIVLCTDNEKVINACGKLKGRMNSIDVLDDYWGEVSSSKCFLPH